MNKILSTLAIFAILCQSAMFANVLDDARAIVGRHDAEVCLVSGNSMTPFFNNGDLVVVKQMNADLLKVGMIVVYENKFGELISHRVLKKLDEGFEVHGYNNAKSDTTILCHANLKGVIYAVLHVRKSDASDHRLVDLKKVLAATPR